MAKSKPTPAHIDPDTIALVREWIARRTGPWTIPEAVAVLVRRGIDAPVVQGLPAIALGRAHPVGVGTRFVG